MPSGACRHYYFTSSLRTHHCYEPSSPQVCRKDFPVYAGDAIRFLVVMQPNMRDGTSAEVEEVPHLDYSSHNVMDNGASGGIGNRISGCTGRVVSALGALGRSVSSRLPIWCWNRERAAAAPTSVDSGRRVNTPFLPRPVGDPDPLMSLYNFINYLVTLDSPSLKDRTELLGLTVQALVSRGFRRSPESAWGRMGMGVLNNHHNLNKFEIIQKSLAISLNEFPHFDHNLNCDEFLEFVKSDFSTRWDNRDTSFHHTLRPAMMVGVAGLSNLHLFCPLAESDIHSRLIILAHRIQRNVWRQTTHPEPFWVVVSRTTLLEDSLASIAHSTGSRLSQGLSIIFAGEDGVDSGGVFRDWLNSVISELFNANYGFFISEVDGVYSINRHTVTSTPGLFRSAGRIIALSLTSQIPVGVKFQKSVLKLLLGHEINSDDFSADYPELSRAMTFIETVDVEDPTNGVEETTFSVNEEIFGKLKEFNLMKKGNKIRINNSNKSQYIELFQDYKLTNDNLRSFVKGFQDILPPRLLDGLFNVERHSRAIEGQAFIDVDDWKRNMMYGSGYTEASRQIAWFWEVMRGLDQETLEGILFFATGQSRIPIGGFANLKQKFKISADPPGDFRLPTANTCFYRLNIPQYSSAEVVKRQIIKLTGYGRVGFGLV
jgi:hypothetical protein